jgi:hypothetical protein
MRFVDFTPATDLAFGDYDRGIPLFGPDRKPVQIQIPRVYAPFGLSGFPNKFGPVKYNIDASLRGWNQDGSYMQKFYNFLREIETNVIDHVRELGTLGPHPEQSFNSNLKCSQNYDPKFRIKVDNHSQFFDAAGNVITPTELEEGLFRGRTFTALVELKSVYFFNRQVGLTWTLVQAKVYDPRPAIPEAGDGALSEKKLNGFQFQV